MKFIKDFKDVKNINIKLNLRVVFAVCILLLIVAVGFSYRELSSIRRDLYAIRTDFYGTASQDNSNYDYTQDSAFLDSQTPNFDIVSQNVEDLRISDDEATNAQPADTTWVQIYKTAKIRVVQILITNDTAFSYSHSDTLGYLDENGVVQRSIIVHPQDDKNSKQTNPYSLEIAPGGKATIYLYFPDTGKEINSIYNSSSMNY